MSAESDLRDAAQALVKAADETKAVAEKANTELKNLGKVTDETKTASDKALAAVNELRQRCDDLEKKAVRPGGAEGAAEVKSAGQQLVESEEYKAAVGRHGGFKGRFGIELKTITSGSTTGASVSTGLVLADRQAGIVQVLPNRPLRVRELVTPGTTSSNAIEYVRETLFTNAAAMVPENPANPKPTSDLQFDMRSTFVRTMAHLMRASKQILDDAPMLQSYIDGRMRYGLDYVEDLQLLKGDGTGENLFGLIPQATPFVAPQGITVTNETAIDVMRLAMLQAELALFPSSGIVLHPTDWAQIELTKNTYGEYIFADPQGTATPRMWGLPVATSLAMTQGQFLTGALKLAAQIFDREQANVLVSTEDVDNFQKNMVTIRAEERLALCVYRPQALIKGSVAPGP